MPEMIYLDYAAATPVAETVLTAMRPFYNEQFFNPSATYLAATRVRNDLDAARAGVAKWLGARPSEVTFTAGGTEANNLAIHGIMRQYPEGNIVVSAIEHDSVLDPAGRYDFRIVKVLVDGRLDLDDLRSKIDGQTVLVSVMYANNEIGTLQPLKEVAAAVMTERKSRLTALKPGATDGQPPLLPILLHSDACQAANYLDLQVARLGVDMLTLNGGKIYGPKQSGVLFVKGGMSLQPLIDGGGQEHGLRSGTENVAQAVGLAQALTMVQSRRHDEAKRLQQLQNQFFNQLHAAIPELMTNGSRKQRLPNNVHVTIPGYDNERLLIQLDEAGIMAAAGSACSASSDEPSHVLRAIGVSDADAQSSLRFTMGQGTTAETVEQTVRILASFIK